MAEFITTPYEPCLKYKQDFDPQDGGDKHNMVVEYTVQIQVLKTNDKEEQEFTEISRILQHKEEKN